MVEINVDSLSKRFGNKEIISDLSFTFPASIIGVAGINGSGKSTLLKCLSGLIKPTSGTIEWRLNGHSVDPVLLRNFLGYVAPYIQLYEELTVSENLKFLIELHDNGHNISISDLLSRFDADKLVSSIYGSLSTGQQQRVKLAASIFHDPDFLILDEPGSNLDRSGKLAVKQLVSQFRSEQKMVLLASNQQDELALCDEIIDLNKQ